MLLQVFGDNHIHILIIILHYTLENVTLIYNNSRRPVVNVWLWEALMVRSDSG